MVELEVSFRGENNNNNNNNYNNNNNNIAQCNFTNLKKDGEN